MGLDVQALWSSQPQTVAQHRSAPARSPAVLLLGVGPGGREPLSKKRQGTHVFVHARRCRRYHECSNGMLRGALTAKKFTLVRLQHALQYLTTLRGFRIGHANAWNLEALFGVKFGVFVVDAQGRLRNKS